MMRAARRLLLLVLLLCAALPAAAQPAKQPEGAAAGAPVFPDRLGAWRLDRVTDYETRPGGAGLGVGANYLPADGGPGIASVFVYDRNRRDLTDGIDSPAAAFEMEQAIRDVETVAPQRRYRLASRQAAEPVPGPDGRPALRCEAMVLALDSGGAQASYACIGVLGGRFVKLRLTRPAEAAGDAGKVTLAFGRQVLGALALTPGR